jgi:farnesyl-diphosphate farnesyltransferase
MSADKANDISARSTNGLLRSVSRSFYLSIRILPARLREPVGLAYLLARTTDTVADTAQIPSEVRAEKLKKLSRAIQGQSDRNGIVDLAASFAPLQKNAAERTLVESFPESLAWLEHLGTADRADIRALLDKITRGQMLDLQRFGGPSEMRALARATDLDEYTYLVAGCVGEFWTQLCFRHLRNFSRLSEEEMLVLSKRYGMGLQLINILRDAGSDLRAGRCYFPAEELIAAGLAPAQIIQQPERFLPIYRRWIEKAETGLVAGMQYSLAIRNRRVRAATALPALIGKRTLTLLRSAGATVLHRNIKVQRAEVRRIIMRLTLSLANRQSIEKMFR